MRNLQRGERVLTPKGKGGVAYGRMAPPTYHAAEVYSVVLDDRKADPNYTGTIFFAKDVFRLATKEDQERCAAALDEPLCQRHDLPVKRCAYCSGTE